MSDVNSIACLVQQLQQGDSQAARRIWELFIHRLIAAARRRLRNLPQRAAGEEDVALSAFDAFFRGVKENRFARLKSYDDLWQVLAMLAERKAIALIRKELAVKRGAGRNRGESVFAKMLAESSMVVGIANVQDPAPAAVDGFTQEVREMLETLKDERLQRIARLRLEGYTAKEIARDLGIARRAVERKLRLIRQKWSDPVNESIN